MSGVYLPPRPTMPEIGEVARVVHYLRTHLVGKTLSRVEVQDDANVYGKVGCTATEFQKAMTGKKVVDARQQGKYFWSVLKYLNRRKGRHY